MPAYRTIISGQKQRREFLSLNKSPLFKDLPNLDFAQEQKTSYNKFVFDKLPKLLSFYFPAEFSDYNNKVNTNITNIDCKEPDFTQEQARMNSVT
jgi:hypothetical protein